MTDIPHATPPGPGGERLSDHRTDAAGYLPTSPLGLLRVHRGELIAVAVIGLLLGIIGLLFPGATAFTVAILFGSYLIASGLFRITAALIADRLSVGQRWLSGILGLLVVILGVLCLSNPFRSLVALAFVIGAGWILEGVVDFMAGLRSIVTPRWLAFVSGVLSIAAGISMFWLPIAGLALLVTVGSVLLIVVSLTTLLTLPRSGARSADRTTA